MIIFMDRECLLLRINRMLKEVGLKIFILKTVHKNKTNNKL